MLAIAITQKRTERSLISILLNIFFQARMNGWERLNPKHRLAKPSVSCRLLTNMCAKVKNTFSALQALGKLNVAGACVYVAAMQSCC